MVRTPLPLQKEQGHSLIGELRSVTQPKKKKKSEIASVVSDSLQPHGL